MSKSMALGVLKDVNYKQRELILEAGDIVFAYTDGITEAVNNYNEIYSEAKLLLNFKTVLSAIDRCNVKNDDRSCKFINCST